MPVGVGADQPGGDLGAVDRPAVDAEVAAQHAEVEAGVVEQLEPARVGEQPAQVGRGVVAGGSCTRCAAPSPADSCTTHSRSRAGLQAHRLGIDRDGVAEIQPGRQVALVQA